MPYIIETSTHEPLNEHMALKTPTGSVAVATLDEARDIAERAAKDGFAHLGLADQDFPPEWDAAVDAAQELPDEGGRVGPLPDGTVIEVRRVSGYALAQRIAPQGTDPRLPNGEKIAQWVAAFNAGSRR